MINISSLSSAIRTIYLIPYVSAKAALNVATDAFDREFSNHGIIFKAFLGGKIRTEAYRTGTYDGPELDSIEPRVMAEQCLDLVNTRTPPHNRLSICPFPHCHIPTSHVHSIM